MSSAAKALDLMSHFSTMRPEIGLSELCRIAKRDKATTYRHLQALEDAGFIEQNPSTKRYRLGPAVLHLAQVREATVPRKDSAQPALTDLANTTGETAHIAILSGTTLYSLMSCESPRHGTRAVIDITTFPLHATASGLCALAFGPENLIKIAQSNLQSFTENTPQTPDALGDLVDNAQRTGFGFANRTLEDEVHGFSAPIFDQTDLFAGSVSVASVASRLTSDLEHTIKSNLIIASREITHNWGGTVPPMVESAWAATLTPANILEPTS